MQNIIQAGEITFKKNKTERIELEVGHFFTSHYLIFDYISNLADGATAPTGKRNFARIAHIIRELKITINDKDDILRMSGVELMAVYLADHGRWPSTVPVVLGNTNQKATLPINQWTTNADVIALTGHDFSRVKKAVMYITWGDESDLYETPNDADLSLRCFVEQQGHHRYRSPLSGRIRQRDGKALRYNPAVRYFFRNEKKFTKSETGVELGRVERLEGGERATCKGLIMFATKDGFINPDAFSGTITIRQGTKTLSKVSVDTLFASHETAKGAEVPRDVLYIPFSALFRNVDFQAMHRWKDDLIIEGDYIFMDGADNYLTILADAYRQERLR